jgi:hypothetical protein
MSSGTKDITYPISGEIEVDTVASSLFEHIGCSNIKHLVNRMKSNEPT